MVFNSLKNGIENEIEFVKKLNNKKVGELDFYMKIFIEDLFGNVDDSLVVNCYKNDLLQKIDIFIKINNVVKRISIKKGVKNSVHTEPISELIHFLIKNKMPKELVISFLKYHYADGSTNGSGLKRLSSLEYKNKHQNIANIFTFILYNKNA